MIEAGQFGSKLECALDPGDTPMADIFLSYAREDLARAEPLVEAIALAQQ